MLDVPLMFGATSVYLLFGVDDFYIIDAILDSSSLIEFYNWFVDEILKDVICFLRFFEAWKGKATTKRCGFSFVNDLVSILRIIFIL